MGCSPSTLRASSRRCEDLHPSLLADLSLRPSKACKVAALLKCMDENKLPYTHQVCLLDGFNLLGTWDICIFISNFPTRLHHTFVVSILKEFKDALDTWLTHLKGFESFRSESVKVRIFGFVLCRGVETDETFEAHYASYPTVRNWKHDDERCPWDLDSNMGKVESMYDPLLDLHSIRIISNKSSASARYHPPIWKNFKHPEGCKGFQTRLWIGFKEWIAHAQRHYLRLSGIIDPNSILEDRRFVLVHEMGHCLALDDMYDAQKYDPDKCPMKPDESIMFRARALTTVDHIMLRHSWMHMQKRKASD